MVIHRVINNNVVSVKDSDDLEKIVMGRGIGFKKKSGDNINDNDIEKIFTLTNKDDLSKFQELVDDIPIEYMILCEEIITYAKANLGKRLNDSIYISLTDHIYTAIKRLKEGIVVRNAMLWDIKRFYPDEYRIGEKAISMVKDRFQVSLPEDEIGFIALHFVNASLDNGNFEDVVKISEIVQQITNIVKYEFNMDFDEESVYFYRFITHLKFFAQRIILGKMYEDGVEEDLFDLVKTRYVNSYNCVKKIDDFISKTYNYKLSKEEILYLTIHVERVVYKEGN